MGLHLVAPADRAVDTAQLWMVIAVALGAVAAAGLACAKTGFKAAGPVFSAGAAVVATFTLFFPKLFAAEMAMFTEDASGALAALLTNPYVYLYVLFNTAALVLMQIAYRHGRAIVVVPIYSSLFMILPVLGAVVLFDEPLSLHQGLGIAVMLSGVVLLTVGGRKAEKVS
jgi:drug/metabolite transporter (DMT)-like permease